MPNICYFFHAPFGSTWNRTTLVSRKVFTLFEKNLFLGIQLIFNILLFQVPSESTWKKTTLVSGK